MPEKIKARLAAGETTCADREEPEVVSGDGRFSTACTSGAIGKCNARIIGLGS